MKRARIIYNPISGKGLMKKNLPYVLERLEKAGYEASAFMTTGKDTAKKEAFKAVENQYDLIIAAGGDGTIYEVVNGIGEQVNRPTLGIIPAGTTNDLTRALGIPRQIEKACDILCNGQTYPIDIGKVSDKYFINVAATGNLVEVTYEVPSRIKRIIGTTAYYLRGILKLPFISPKPIRIEYDDNVYEGNIFFVIICNTASVGGFDHIANNSKFDDGLFDILIFEMMSIKQMLKLGRQIVSHSNLEHAKVKYIQAKHVKIESSKSLKLNLDGEFGGMLPIELINLHHHLNILLPKKE